MPVIMFTGQGSQFPGMGRDVLDEFPEHLAQADEVLGYSVRDLCLHDEHGRLASTRYAQPALYVVNVLTYLRLRRECGVEPSALLGHSLGEYCALHVAGVFDFASGLALVARRGELMADAAGGGMAAVIGLDADAVHDALASWSGGGLWAAGYNTPDQTVLSGSSEQVRAARQHFLDAGARSYVPLNVSGAFHSPLMASAKAEFARVLDRAVLRAPRIPVVSNSTGRLHTADRLGLDLGEQISGPVRWVQSVRLLAGRGETGWIEAGPKKVLTPMVGAVLAA
ncbi:trans-AT polyketide synthase, acyltransferase and oxidoreductase domain-containing protein [Lentzea fradiae]|uniref:Malonyl CoA-acyl carrier protein transacylase n=1 Tax=Lentzea fradiae TaxID=200378 RepID=A0A1G7XHY2_9PSEU|nr:ACP S-malonyltransferase [Lentzea fradiae]SDG83802.1 trans-AT polyketide synthase, acyltransferase and oxidoreductase domain-containing protein [Lentzea fradiae]